MSGSKCKVTGILVFVLTLTADDAAWSSYFGLCAISKIQFPQCWVIPLARHAVGNYSCVQQALASAS